MVTRPLTDAPTELLKQGSPDGNGPALFRLQEATWLRRMSAASDTEFQTLTHQAESNNEDEETIPPNLLIHPHTFDVKAFNMLRKLILDNNDQPIDKLQVSANPTVVIENLLNLLAPPLGQHHEPGLSHRMAQYFVKLRYRASWFVNVKCLHAVWFTPEALTINAFHITPLMFSRVNWMGNNKNVTTATYYGLTIEWWYDMVNKTTESTGMHYVLGHIIDNHYKWAHATELTEMPINNVANSDHRRESIQQNFTINLKQLLIDAKPHVTCHYFDLRYSGTPIIVYPMALVERSIEYKFLLRLFVINMLRKKRD